VRLWLRAYESTAHGAAITALRIGCLVVTPNPGCGSSVMVQPFD